MKRSVLSPLLYSIVMSALWIGVLPALLLGDRERPLADLWRPVPLIVLAVIVALVGVVAVFAPSRALYDRGVPLFGVAPGPVLVTDGWYGRVRNPQHIGTVLMALAPAIALDHAWLWSVPAVAAAWLVAGLEPLEDRRLLEEFGDDFREYRTAVSRWLPKMGN